MDTPVAYGIDLGTTNSAISVAYDDGAVEVLGTPEELTQSLIYLHRNLNRLVGEKAVRAYLDTAAARTSCSRCDLVDRDRGAVHTECRNYVSGGDCFDARLIAQVKAEMANEDFHGTHSWAQDFQIEDLVSIIMSRLKKAADDQLGAIVNRVTVGHPVRFAGAEGNDFARLQNLALQRLESAAVRAGFTEHVELMAESKAAVAIEGVTNGVLLCLDFGGGTFDVALIDVRDTRSEVLALKGVAVGGEEFDAKMFDAFVAPALGLNSEFTLDNGQVRHLPAQLRTKLRSLRGVNELMSENLAASASTMLAGSGNDEVLSNVNALVTGGAAWRLFQAVKTAKHDLSNSVETSINMRAGELSLTVPVTRSEFESIIEADLNQVRYCVEDAVEDAGVEVDEVAYVSRTGGSSQIPAFNRMVEDIFVNADHVQMDPFTSVVRGLGRHAYEVWSA
ncbi:Hsp70 family protein [Actinomycetota bacterium]|nr:Hsp70 family protein [Actinomycetota bacterium]